MSGCLIPHPSLLIPGFVVAAAVIVARRVTALFGIAVLLGLVLLLVWEVYAHHRTRGEVDEPVVVALDVRVA